MIALIVNPRAGRGRAAARAAEVERALSAYGEVRRWGTHGAGDERRCARDACEAGARVVAVLGGDGAVHHAARGLLESGAPDAPTEVPLAVFAAGTGNDFVKSLGSPSHDVQAMAARVGRGDTRVVDVGHIDGVPFLNAAGLGFDVEVLERMQTVRWVRGTAAYVVTALRALLGYRGHDAVLTSASNSLPEPYESAREASRESSRDGRAPRVRDGEGMRLGGPHLLTVFANGRTFGGAFRIAPDAALDDGRLVLVNIGALAPLARPGVFLRAVRGTHLTHDAVTHARGERFAMTAAAPLRFEADGERYVARGTRVEIGVRARALRVVI